MRPGESIALSIRSYGKDAVLNELERNAGGDDHHPREIVLERYLKGGLKPRFRPIGRIAGSQRQHPDRESAAFGFVC
jgi:hypothetical protein